MRKVVYYVFFLFSIIVVGQDFLNDTKYLEDQFYTGLTYNVLHNKSGDLNQQNLSYGLYGGFIKDMPINESRTVAIGLGFGYATNSYYTNLKADRSGNNIVYSFLDGNVDYKRNKIETHLIEIPIQIRWRKSTPNNYKFLRIYGGVKLGYAFAARSKFVSKDEKKAFQNTDIQKFHYGLQFNIGYNTWNAYVYYGLNNLFKNNILASNNVVLKMSPIHLGFIFYIL